jgi:hypothetical protein
VPDGWGAGAAAGAGAGLALAALFAVTMLVQRRRPWVSGSPQAILGLTILLLWVVALLASLPPRQVVPHSVHYVITSAVEVAEIAYAGTWLALFAVLVAVRGALALVRGRDPFG